VLRNRNPAFRVVFIDVVLKVSKGKLITVLELPVRVGLDLNGVIREVDKSIINVLQINAVGRATHPQVAFWEEEQVRVVSQQDPHADIELALVDQQGPLNVLLDDEGVKLYFIY
jgi:hypothetical protein